MELNKYRHVVVLTGAGISAESGIKTFRDQDGLWENHKIEDVATPQGFLRNKTLVNQFYDQRRRQLLSPEVKPNLAHVALAEFEANFKGKFTLITQNVDNLHQRAGSKNIIPMHGELLKVRCLRTDKIFEWHGDVTSSTPCPCCQKAGGLRPHIVWFGEMPLFMDEIEESLRDCDLFLAIGTSGQVYPAAMFVQTARHQAQAHTIEFNLEKSANHSDFHQQIFGPAATTVPLFFTRT